MYLGYYILFTFLLILLFVGQKVTKKPSLLKKLNGSVSNQFATCSTCGTRLLRKLKHPRLLLQVPCYLKFRLFFESRGFAQIRTLVNFYDKSNVAVSFNCTKSLVAYLLIISSCKVRYKGKTY